MPRTKSLKQLTSDYDVNPTTLIRWFHKKFPHWFDTGKKGKPKMNATKY